MRDIKDPQVRRAEIMEAAVTLFTAKGYLNTTTQDIIEKLKISRGLLYYHFKNKEDILFCIVDKYTRPLIYTLESVISLSEQTAVEKVRKFIELTMIPDQSITQEQEVLQEAVNLEENRYMMDCIYHNIANKMTECFTAIIEQGNKEGVFDVLYPRETAAFLMTGYAFVANDASCACTNREQLENYIHAFKGILEKALASNQPIF